MIFIVIAISLFITDFFVKNWAEKKLEMKAEKEIFCNKIIIRKFHNHGAALNILENKKNILLFLNITLVSILSLIYAKTILNSENAGKKLSMSFLVAGGWNNLYDRMKKGYVVDYFSFNTKIKKLKAIVFNLSDFFIFIGSFLLLISESSRKK